MHREWCYTPPNCIELLKLNIVNKSEIKDKVKWDYIFVGHHHYFYDYKDLGVVDVGTSGCVYDNKTHLVTNVKNFLSFICSLVIYSPSRNNA